MDERVERRRGRYTVSLDARVMTRLDALARADPSGLVTRSWLVETAIAHFLQQVEHGTVSLSLPGVHS